MNGRILTLLALALLGGYFWTAPLSAPLAEDLARMVDVPPGFEHAVSIDAPPLQNNLQQRPTMEVADYRFTLMADFQLEARVLGRKNYRRDAGARLAPIDLALGWGAMARPEIIEQFNIRQRRRFYFWRADEYPIPRQEIIASSANMHLIPASPEVLDALKRVRQGDVVRLRGYLVNVDRNDGWRWRTSMVRTDSGDGACELFLVTLAEVFPL
ncbi:MAG: hypothetical protein ACXIUL_00460 [Wenzhouxiangella sp.]